MAGEMTEKQRAALEAHQIKPGEVRNPTGRNGWSVMRERYQVALDEKLDTLTTKLLEIAESGDVQALRLALGPVIDIRSIELSGPDGEPINFMELANKAREETDA